MRDERAVYKFKDVWRAGNANGFRAELRTAMVTLIRMVRERGKGSRNAKLGSR
jgi:hypothetical protein